MPSEGFKGGGLFYKGVPIDITELHQDFRTVVWDGQQDPTDNAQRNIAVRIGDTTGDSPYDSDDKYWDLNPNKGVRWHAGWVDWQNFGLEFRLTQSQHNWACTVFWGSTTSTITSDASIRSATGAMGAWIGRPTTATGDQFDTSGWNIMLMSSAEAANLNIAAQRIFNGAINKTDVGKKHVQLPSSVLSGDGPHDFVFRQYHDNMELFVNETRYAQYTLNENQQNAATGGYMGVAGDGSNANNKTLRLYKWLVEYPYDAVPSNA